MKDSEERKLINTAKNKAISVLVGLFIAGVVALVFFYFTGTAALAQNTTDIKELKAEIKKVTTVPVLNQTEIKHIKKDVARIEKNLKENHKENKEALKELRKEQQKMTELLFKIAAKMNN